MATIRLPRRFDNRSDVDVLEKIWRESVHASYEIPDSLSEIEIRCYFSILLPMLPNDFAASILADLAERESTPVDLLDTLFDKGDIGCQVSVCLRTDIPQNLVQKCIQSSNPDVLEHAILNVNVSIADCQKLLKTEIGKTLEPKIKGAMSRKVS